jgi:4-diphosphocytidyl-2-C-methyl-D-erythritol kinase
VEPIALEANFNVLLLKPDFGVATRWAYGRWKGSRELPDIDYSSQEFENLHFVNDLERPVFEKFVFLARLKSWLRQQPEVAVGLMSGSGSTMFTVLHEGADPEELTRRVRAEIDPKLWTFATQLSSSTSPPHTRD